MKLPINHMYDFQSRMTDSYRSHDNPNQISYEFATPISRYIYKYHIKLQSYVHNDISTRSHNIAIPATTSHCSLIKSKSPCAQVRILAMTINYSYRLQPFLRTLSKILHYIDAIKIFAATNSCPIDNPTQVNLCKYRITSAQLYENMFPILQLPLHSS